MSSATLEKPESAEPAAQGDQKPSSRRMIILLGAGLALAALALVVRSSPPVREAIWSHASLPGLQQAAAGDSGDDILYYYLGKRSYQGGRFADARAAYEKAARLAPQSARVHLGLGLTLDELGDDAEATAELEEALRYDPGLAWAHYLLGKIAWERDDVPTALTHMQRATELDPRSAQCWYGLATCYARSGKYDEAITALQRNLSVHEQDARGQTSLGELLIYRSKLDEGRQHLERALQIDPAYGPAYAILGNYLFVNGEGRADRDRAEQLLLRASQIPSAYAAQTYFDLGQIHLGRQDFKRAVADLKRSIHLDPSKERPFYALSAAYRGLGDNASADNTYRQFHVTNKELTMLAGAQLRVLEHGSDLRGWLTLARRFRDLGMLKDSLKAYTRVLRADEDPQLVSEYNDVLQRKTENDRYNRPDFTGLTPE